MANQTPLILAGRSEHRERHLEVPDRSGAGPPTEVALAGPQDVEGALAASAAARGECAALARHARERALRQTAEALEARAEEFCELIVSEVGKPRRDARGEVSRAVSTFRLSAAECSRAGGESMELDHLPATEGYSALTRRVPIGVCSLITPFNFPLNLVAHKVAPAIAAGCPFVLKPSDKAPRSALALGELLLETDLPRGAINVLPLEVEHAGPLIDDERVAFLSFTGSDRVGWELARRAAPRRVALELGGNAACIVDEGSDLEDAVSRLIVGTFGQSGQSCISVQRIVGHHSLFAELRERLIDATSKLVVGDPRSDATVVGPLIDEDAARRLEGWIADAARGGARTLIGGERQGAVLQPTLLENVPHDSPLWCAEAFGPVAVLEPFDDFDEALNCAGEGPFGLQAGLFTGNLDRALRAFEQLEVGALVVGDVPTFRSDAMPYGGVKRSGMGREGPRYAIEEMTELRTLILHRR
ncbi:aldehyde dehydrogenase family protein [Engelhardtia mirabilis]|uniref:Sulfoacetaldehyde dehydrogenase n=1 Tax=Engelhardtia mirabilis TaxID=2528011 RepID=A0A518BJ37_9BACT|nr:Sulfoacetaldehyde dehydrogenase [Planctomycetes bacterium Pla133]QDV01291.1 Sulfoacetaldehyde dehydrogenase [Planctomycetes bacterium Pla86]